MFAVVPSAVVIGARGHRVSVECSIAGGLPGFDLLGLPDASCREAKDRVRAALSSCGVSLPRTEVVVNLAPPYQRKVGAGLDLAIAVSLLVATEKIASEAVAGLAFVGELGLDGTIRRIPGLAPTVGVRPDTDWVVPAAGLAESRAAVRSHIRPVRHLREIIDAACGAAPWPDPDDAAETDATAETADSAAADAPDLTDVRGQTHARFALEVAAAGGHHLLLIGPPGSGKTMLARRLSGILPDLDHETALEATMIHSAEQLIPPNCGLLRRPPFRAPHHTSSQASIVGGGSHTIRMGEANLAHGGILFLDELGQFNHRVLDALRESFEQGYTTVGRVHSDRLPTQARFQLVAATNPCPCGGGGPGSCSCDHQARRRYLSTMSGPFLDRFDLRIAVERPAVADLIGGDPGESSAVVAERVAAARQIAVERNGGLNAALTQTELDRYALVSDEVLAMLTQRVKGGKLSARGVARVRRVARTLADLGGDPAARLADEYVAAALAMRSNISADFEDSAA